MVQAVFLSWGRNSDDDFKADLSAFSRRLTRPSFGHAVILSVYFATENVR